MNLEPLRGMRDFYPREMARLNVLFSTWKVVLRKYNYLEIDGPLLEDAKLWELKSGNEIPEQMYSFKDKSDKHIAIRPELTPTLARMVAKKYKELVKPVKWFALARCFRYEAPQAGRLREHFQLNVDCLGSSSMRSDAEVIASAVDIMTAFGCTEKDFYIRLNNRKLIDALLSKAGVKKQKLKEAARIIDKKEKISEKEFLDQLLKAVDDQDVVDNIQKALELQFGLVDNSLEGYAELKELLWHLESYGLSRFVRVDFSIMRGFDYYTSTVFEVFDASREFRAIAGGGRYDNLIADFGGDPCPGVGYGMGDVVLGLFLEKLGKLKAIEDEVEYFVAPVSDEVIDTAIKIAASLRKKHSVDIDVSGKGLSKLLEYASNIKAGKVIIVGKKDLENKEVTVRDMISGQEKKLKLKSLLGE